MIETIKDFRNYRKDTKTA